jgi:hypothetical protein
MVIDEKLAILIVREVNKLENVSAALSHQKRNCLPEMGSHNVCEYPLWYGDPVLGVLGAQNDPTALSFAPGVGELETAAESNDGRLRLLQTRRLMPTSRTSQRHELGRLTA